MAVNPPTILRRVLDRSSKEQPWQKQVEETLTFFGWWWFHAPPNVIVCPKCHWKIFRGMKKGLPDIIAIKPPQILWIELKTERGQLEPEQTEVGRMLLACGQTWLRARPRDREELYQLIAA